MKLCCTDVVFLASPSHRSRPTACNGSFWERSWWFTLFAIRGFHVWFSERSIGKGMSFGYLYLILAIAGLIEWGTYSLSNQRQDRLFIIACHQWPYSSLFIILFLHQLPALSLSLHSLSLTKKCVCCWLSVCQCVQLGFSNWSELVLQLCSCIYTGINKHMPGYTDRHTRRHAYRHTYG